MSTHGICKTNCGGTSCTAKVVVRDDGPRIDLGRYAGTYGGYTEATPPRTLWQRFRAWLHLMPNASLSGRGESD